MRIYTLALYIMQRALSYRLLEPSGFYSLRFRSAIAVAPVPMFMRQTVSCMPWNGRNAVELVSFAEPSGCGCSGVATRLALSHGPALFTVEQSTPFSEFCRRTLCSCT